MSYQRMLVLSRPCSHCCGVSLSVFFFVTSKGRLFEAEVGRKRIEILRCMVERRGERETEREREMIVFGEYSGARSNCSWGGGEERKRRGGGGRDGERGREREREEEEKETERERGREIEREGERDTEREREIERGRERYREKERYRERERQRETERDRERNREEICITNLNNKIKPAIAMRFLTTLSVIMAGSFDV